MKKLLLALSAAVLFSGAAQAERYVMVTHGEGKDPFWPVVQKGGEDAARAIGSLVLYNEVTLLKHYELFPTSIARFRRVV